MALLDGQGLDGMLNGLDGLLDACETARSQLSEEEAAAPTVGGSAPVLRAPRSRPKRSRDEVVEAANTLLTQSPAKRPAVKRPVGKPTSNPTPGADGRPAGRRARAPRSPDEKRKLSRQMAAFMRYGVLVLPENVKARLAGKGWMCADAPPDAAPRALRAPARPYS